MILKASFSGRMGRKGLIAVWRGEKMTDKVVDEVSAYLDVNGRLHLKMEDAIRANFAARFRAALMSISAETYNRTPVGDIAHDLTCGVYPTAAQKLLEALEYWRFARLVVEARKSEAA